MCIYIYTVFVGFYSKIEVYLYLPLSLSISPQAPPTEQHYPAAKLFLQNKLPLKTKASAPIGTVANTAAPAATAGSAVVRAGAETKAMFRSMHRALIASTKRLHNKRVQLNVESHPENFWTQNV